MLDYRISYKIATDTDFIVYKLNYTMTEVIVINLVPGTQYNFKVESVNLVGYSPFSETIIELAAQVPDAPTNLVNRPEITLRDQIGLSWVIPVFEGGSPVIDYAVWYDNALGGELMLLEDNIVEQTYTAINLEQG